MKRSDITDRMVCEAYRDYRTSVVRVLMQMTGAPEKVVYAAMQRACDRGLVEYGVSLHTGWLTEAGKALLASERC